jgi:hypothetical protein
MHAPAHPACPAEATARLRELAAASPAGASAASTRVPRTAGIG